MSVRSCMSSRVDISDTLMYVYEMLGAELLSNLYDKLGRLLTNAEQPTSWQVGETQTDKHEENYFLLLCCMEASAVKCVILDLKKKHFSLEVLCVFCFSHFYSDVDSHFQNKNEEQPKEKWDNVTVPKEDF